MTASPLDVFNYGSEAAFVSGHKSREPSVIYPVITALLWYHVREVWAPLKQPDKQLLADEIKGTTLPSLFAGSARRRPGCYCRGVPGPRGWMGRAALSLNS